MPDPRSQKARVPVGLHDKTWGWKLGTCLLLCPSFDQSLPFEGLVSAGGAE